MTSNYLNASFRNQLTAYLLSTNQSIKLIRAISIDIARFFIHNIWNENGCYGMHSQHSAHSAPGSRMDGMAFSPFRNMNAK